VRFLDQKEEIITFELTSYGRKLYSQGNFKPFYYALLDDCVMYDVAYSGQAEAQNDTDARIRDYPTMEPQTAYDGVESSLSRRTNYQGNYDSGYAIAKTLGNSAVGSSCAPAFGVSYYKSGLDDMTAYISGSYSNILIPQLYSNLQYLIETEVSSSGNGKFVSKSRVFDDGTCLGVESDEILVGVDEKNVSFMSENFDIEVFRVENYTVGGNLKENLIPLTFLKRKKQVLTENLELKDETEDILEEELIATSDNVEYYFDVLVDSEIPSSEMCRIQDKGGNYFLSGKKEACRGSSSSKDYYSGLEEDTSEGKC
jgi:hypothetical protein